MKDRILEFLKAENKSSAQLAEEIGVQPSGISHIISGRNKPSLDFVLKMLEKYPFISTEWLLFGRGTMYNDKSMQELFDKSSYIALQNENESDKKDIVRPEINKNDIPNVNPQKKENVSITRIVLFYSNNSFQEYFPGNN
ncbi:MAG: helix-turn-helix domain-containing protein [Bacteroidales bacterium]|jgi:transcriptional regulator with XRE-family HTH domain|nr:helix-turn-helix domain-containing protein [Bacteroidales bacterium]NMD03056.1 helix-turn-helix transcriptional regulator [Bacteroidales bacterium]OQB65573.1 MAG: helix-turn-helix protein [Bacteroidetes bacterium ADurb.Bin145]HOU01113.1 helix-turn-helix transcriptional regulator [Bacteroidales bacterium]HQK68351.1 helix-turn-helix transcriptional regulator [Bacteroidales bacterium]